MRGGTSKAVFFAARELPADAELRDRLLLSVMGSPDPRQIDGLGGADPLTSKVAIVGPSSRPGADVDYTFAQVAVDRAEVSYVNNCGNISSAVGPYAIDEAMLPVLDPSTTVRIFNTNTGKLILSRVSVVDGRAATEGEARIDGVPGTGSQIDLTFCDPGGAVTGSLLPTGRALEEVVLDESTRLSTSVVDCGTLYAFVPAADLALQASESPAEIEARPGLMARVGRLREVIAGRLADAGVVSADKGRALRTSLKVAVVGPAPAGSPPGIDVVARILNPGKVHKAFAVTGAIALAGAAAIPGSVVGGWLGASGSRRLVIGHPAGEMAVEVESAGGGGLPRINGVTLPRTARRIMDGFVYVPRRFAESATAPPA
jgi:2-methylaconitate cis-trans-isomerase PrpF